MAKYNLKLLIILFLSIIIVYLSFSNIGKSYNPTCLVNDQSNFYGIEKIPIPNQNNTSMATKLSSKLTSKSFQNTKEDRLFNTILRLFPDNKFLTILMITDDVKDDVSIRSMNDKYEYAFKHKYGLLIDDNRTKRPAAWSKIVSILNLFEQGYEWVWSLDRDTIIANPNIEVDKMLRLIDKKYSIVISIDCATINSGSFFVRNSEWSIKFLQKVFNTYGNEVGKSDAWYENKAFYLFYKRNESNLLDNIYLVPQWSINIYPSENRGCRLNNRSYEHGDFVIHFAGLMNFGARKDLYKKYFNEIRLQRLNLSYNSTESWLRRMNLTN